MLTDTGKKIFGEQVLTLFDKGYMFSDGELEDIRWNFVVSNEICPLKNDSLFSPHVCSKIKIKDRLFKMYWIARYPDIEIYDHQLEEIKKK